MYLPLGHETGNLSTYMQFYFPGLAKWGCVSLGKGGWRKWKGRHSELVWLFEAEKYNHILQPSSGSECNLSSKSISLSWIVYSLYFVPAWAYPSVVICSSIFRYRGECFPSLEPGPRENGASRERRRQCRWARRVGQRCLRGAHVRHEWGGDPAEPRGLRQQLWFSLHRQPHGVLSCFQPALQEEDEENIKGRFSVRTNKPNRKPDILEFVSTVIWLLNTVDFPDISGIGLNETSLHFTSAPGFYSFPQQPSHLSQTSWRGGGLQTTTLALTLTLLCD